MGLCIVGSGVCGGGGGGGGGGGEDGGTGCRERGDGKWLGGASFTGYCAILFPFVNSILRIHC